MIIYHGTDSTSAKNIIETGIDLKYGDESVDNAQGFYMTPNYEFAAQRARTTTASHNKFHQDNARPCVLVIDFELPDSNVLSIKEFPSCCYEWQEFVLFNRLGKRFLRKWKINSDNHNLDFKYDVVIDETADSQIGSAVSSIRYGNPHLVLEDTIKKVAVSNRPNWDKQISIHSNKAVKICVRSMKIQHV